MLGSWLLRSFNLGLETGSGEGDLGGHPRKEGGPQGVSAGVFAQEREGDGTQGVVMGGFLEEV